MCIVAAAWDCLDDYLLILASNRDEFYERPTAPLGWIPVVIPHSQRVGDEEECPGRADDEKQMTIVGGLDVRCGGTWLGVSPIRSRIAVLTNIREPPIEVATSRGHLVTGTLMSQLDAKQALESIDADNYNGFNLLAFDLCPQQSIYLTNRPGTEQSKQCRALERGVHCISNVNMSRPWPKTEKLQALFSGVIQEELEAMGGQHQSRSSSSSSPSELADRIVEKCLWNAERCSDRSRLPVTHLSEMMEHDLSSIFVRTKFSGGEAPYDYGTRSSSVVIVGRNRSVTVVEWSRKCGAAIDTSTRSVAASTAEQVGPDEKRWERREVTFEI